MIARAYGASIVGRDKKCAMDTDPFRNAMNSTILKLWRAKNPMANLNIVPQDARFEAWRSEALSADPLRLQPTFCCQDANPFGPGMTIISPSRIRSGLLEDLTFIGSTNETSRASILPAFMPGNNGYIGASGFSMVRGSLSPSFAWSLIAFSVHPANRFLSEMGHFSQTLPPYKSLLDRVPFNSVDYNLLKVQFQNVAPFHGPLDTIEFSGDFVDRKPLRMFLLETAFKFVPLDQAIERACTVINTFSLPSCSQTTFTQSIRQCDARTGYRKVELAQSQLMNATCRIAVDRQVGTNLDCTFVAFESAFGISAAILNGVGVFAAIATLLILVRTKDSRVIEASILSQLTIMTGGFFMLLAGLFYLGTPNNGFCVVRVWLLNVGFVLSFGMIVAMLVRQQFGRRVMQTAYGCLLGVNGALLLVWTFLPIPLPPLAATTDLLVKELERGNAIRIQTPICSNGNVNVLVAMVALNALLLLTGMGLAVRSSAATRTVWMPRRMTLVALISALLGIVAVTSVVTQSVERNRVFALSMGSFFVGLFGLMFFAWPTLLKASREQPSSQTSITMQQQKYDPEQNQLPRELDRKIPRDSPDWFVHPQHQQQHQDAASVNHQRMSTQSYDEIVVLDEDGSNFSMGMEAPPAPRNSGAQLMMASSQAANKESMFIIRPLTMMTSSSMSMSMDQAQQQQAANERRRSSNLSFMTSVVEGPAATATAAATATRGTPPTTPPISQMAVTTGQGLPSIEILPTPPPPVVLRDTIFQPLSSSQKDDEDLQQQQQPPQANANGNSNTPTMITGDEDMLPATEMLRMRRSTYLSRYSSALSDATRMSTVSRVHHDEDGVNVFEVEDDDEDELESPDADVLRDAMLQRFKSMSIAAELAGSSPTVAKRSSASQRDSLLAPLHRFGIDTTMTLMTTTAPAPAPAAAENIGSSRSSLLNEYYGQL